jgi:hypothetical protein
MPPVKTVSVGLSFTRRMRPPIGAFDYFEAKTRPFCVGEANLQFGLRERTATKDRAKGSPGDANELAAEPLLPPLF